MNDALDQMIRKELDRLPESDVLRRSASRKSYQLR